MSRKPPPLVGVVGARKTGKTAWMIQAVKRARPRRLLVWDPEEQCAQLGTVFSDRVKLVDYVGAAQTAAPAGGKFAAVFRPGDDVEAYPALFDWFCRLAWALKDLTLVVDELADVTSPTSAPAIWKAISRRGANQGIAVFGLTQRPNEVDGTFLGNCTFLHCGRQNKETDVKTIAGLLCVSPDVVRGLKSDPDSGVFEYIERNMNTGETSPVQRLKFG